MYIVYAALSYAIRHMTHGKGQLFSLEYMGTYISTHVWIQNFGTVVKCEQSKYNISKAKNTGEIRQTEEMDEIRALQREAIVNPSLRNVARFVGTLLQNFQSMDGT